MYLPYRTDTVFRYLRFQIYIDLVEILSTNLRLERLPIFDPSSSVISDRYSNSLLYFSSDSSYYF